MMKPLIAAVVLLWGVAALAAGLEVAPVLVTLDKSNTNATITLRNGGDEAVRYQLEVNTWGESPDGAMQLGPTREVVVFPQMLALKPGEQRNVRVGYLTPPGNVERSYRLFISEMPPEHQPGSKVMQVQVLTRVGVPIFVAPLTHSEKTEVAKLAVKGGKASFAVKNSGTVYVRPTKISLIAEDSAGKSLFEKDWQGWYVLAGNEHDYSIDVPAAACRKAKTFRAEVAGDRLSISASVPADGQNCGP